MTTQAQLDEFLAPFGDKVRQHNWKLDSSSYVAMLSVRMSIRDEVAEGIKSNGFTVRPSSHLLPVAGFAACHCILLEGTFK